MIDLPNGNQLNPLVILRVGYAKGYRTHKISRKTQWFNKKIEQTNKSFIVKYWAKKETTWFNTYWTKPSVIFYGSKGEVVSRFYCKSNAEAKHQAEYYKKILEDELEAYKGNLN